MSSTPATPPAVSRPLWQRLLLRRLKFLLGVVVILALALGGSYLFAPQWLLRANVTRQAMAAHLETRTVQAGDTRWSYYEGGEGPTMVLLHGYASSKDVWLKVAKELTPHFHLIIPDLPGWGDSSRSDSASYDIDAQAARLDEFVRALGLRGVTVVGHSMGGAIAGVYAAAHPDVVERLALVDSFGLASKEKDFARSALAGANPFDYDDRAGFQRATALAFEKVPDVRGRFVDVLIRRNQRDRAFLDRTFDALRLPSQYLSVQQRLDQLTMPVMGLWCRDDKIVDVSALDSLRNGLVHAAAISTTTLSGCNHMPMLEKPEQTAQVLTAFQLSH
ncbi:alpha/beta hydrolase [Dyella sp.]|uniref:alpha/beta fold hydrolase n=1 Tax=Dyella sp. TaxID=1869338 RepID=UPI002D7798D5|nr:alpha/beta hydrolase [Dyella sp.]HET6430687.1 alpha/beta hydrolase [Dyella sp.]